MAMPKLRTLGGSNVVASTGGGGDTANRYPNRDLRLTGGPESATRGSDAPSQTREINVVNRYVSVNTGKGQTGGSPAGLRQAVRTATLRGEIPNNANPFNKRVSDEPAGGGLSLRGLAVIGAVAGAVYALGKIF